MRSPVDARASPNSNRIRSWPSPRPSLVETLKIATYWWAGRRQVGRLSADERDVLPLALGERAHAVGALALAETMAPRRNMFCIGFDPPKFLRRGDRVRIDIEGIGTLSNPVQ
jgi:hypothetical protein